MVPLKGLSFPFAPEHLPGWESTHRRLAHTLRAAAAERLGSAGYTEPKLLPLPRSSELSLQITSWMTETWQGEWQRQAELRARKAQLPCAGVIREMQQVVPWAWSRSGRSPSPVL